MSFAFRCQGCNGEPLWRLFRRGDAVVSWACAEHLSEVACGLQRRQTIEITELVIVYLPTVHDHVDIKRRFDAVAQEYES